MREAITEALKGAMRGGDKRAVGTLRLMNAAIKDRDIANRGAGKGAADDDELRQLLAKMIKQREESAAIFEANARPELAENERAEIAVIRGFLPEPLEGAAMEAAVRDAVAETGAKAIADMGRVMAALKGKFAGRMDFAKANGIAKGLLG